MRSLSLRTKLLLGCGFAVALVAGGVLAFWPREPVYGGKPLSYWLDQLPALIVSPPGPPMLGNLHFIQYSVRPTPEEADKVAILDSPSRPPSLNNLRLFPYLDDLWQPSGILAHPTSQTDQSLASFMSPPRPQNYGRLQFLQNVGDPQQALALFSVVALGQRCLPTLLRRLQARDRDGPFTLAEKKVQEWAIKLHLMRASAVGHLSPDVRRGQAVLAILRLGDVAKPMLPGVIKLAKTAVDPGVRASALEVLRHLSPADYASVVAQTNPVTAARVVK